MLITNFSSGELSKTLFGRTDLPQYYSGAARMENFDVIPTGGIKRRNGTERLLKLTGGDGRIIPFAVNRDLGFLLVLTDKKITAYKLEKGIIYKGLVWVWEDTNGEAGSSSEGQMWSSLNNLYESDEIGGVQYTQNFDTMILCHENRPPLEVQLQKDPFLQEFGISIRTLQMDFETPVIAGKNISDKDRRPYEKDDSEYKANGWLKTKGNYPSSVCFYNGRLIFAATENNKQRIFASAIKQPNKNYSFFTYKTFLTEKKEYSNLLGKIDPDDTSIMNGEQESIISTFDKPPELYYVDSQLYPEGTRIEYINLTRVKLTERVKPQIKIYDVAEIMDMLRDRKRIYEEAENENDGKGKEYVIYTGRWRTRVLFGTGSQERSEQHEYDSYIKCYVKGASIKIAYYSRHRYYDSEKSLWYYFKNSSGDGGFFDSALEDEEKWIKDWTLAYDTQGSIRELNENEDRGEIISKYDEYLSMLHSDTNPYLTGTDRIHQGYPTEPTFTNYGLLNSGCIGQLFANVRATMFFELPTVDGTEMFYNEPGQNLADVYARIADTNKAYIGLYTREIIADEYPTPDCGFTFEIGSDMNDAIRWLAVNKGLIAGTETGEWIIPPDVNAASIRASLNSRYGSGRIQGTAVGDATCFFQTGKKSLVEYYIPQQDNNFRANNMAMLSPEMLNEAEALEFDYASSPHAKLFITRKGGTMVTLLYERSTGTFAWGRITTGPEQAIKIDQWRRKRLAATGKIKSAAVLPGHDGIDGAFLLVQRGNNFYLERLREAGDDSPAVYLDCYMKVDKDASWKETRGLYGAEGVGLCRIFKDEEGVLKYEALDADAEPDLTKGGDYYIGYRYTSVLRTMPVLANSQMKKQRIVSLVFRFLESYLPNIASVAGGRTGGTDVPGGRQPFSGIFKHPFPGTWDEDVQAELTADEPVPVTVLALNAVMEGAH